jgi:hypothetical protein
MPFDRWERDKAGTGFMMHAHCGHEFLVYAGIGIGLRLEFLRPGDQIGNPTGYVQLALTNEGAKLLARDLSKAISQTERVTDPKN